jgi:hypothetical protein
MISVNVQPTIVEPNDPRHANTRRFDRSSGLALGIVLLIAVASVAATAAALARVGDGCLLDSDAETGLFGACVADWPTPLRRGDQVIAIDGVALWDDLTVQQPQAPPGWVDGGTARYTIKRGDATLDLDVPLRRMGWDGILRAFGYCLAQQAPDWDTFALIGAIVIFALAPRARAAQLLLIAIGGLTAAVALTSPSNSVGANFAPAPVWFLILFVNLSWGWLFAPTILLLVLSFPRRVWPFARWPRLTVALIYGLPLAAIATSLITTNVIFYLAALGLGALCLVVATVAVTAYTFLRVRDPVVRAQTAWLAFGLAIGLAVWPVLFVLGFVFPGLEQAMDRLPRWLGLPILAVLTLAFPICLGIAITRYRLFDIEIIIRRTLVYSLLTLTLALIYVGCIVLSRTLVAPLTGGSDVAIVASTLAIAGLFTPLRRRIQNIIDKRFYRRKYDAAKVLAAFGATARDETVLERLTAEMLRVVNETVQPEFVGLWISKTGPDD